MYPKANFLRPKLTEWEASNKSTLSCICVDIFEVRRIFMVGMFIMIKFKAKCVRSHYMCGFVVTARTEGFKRCI